MKVHLSSLTLQNFFSIINNLDKIEVKIEDENQALLLLRSLPSPYKRFREAIIYGGKSIIKVNEVKDNLLNKDKIDTQLTGESHRMIPGKFIIQGRRVIMEVPRVTQNIGI